MTTLHVQSVSASYGATPVVHDVDLVVHAGTTTAVLGSSGCGKTTLLRVIAGFHRPTGGEVRFGDQVFAGPKTFVPPERRGIGYLAQDGALFPHLSVADNIAFGLPRRERRESARVGELLELVGLDHALRSRRPDQLSGGQQQRVALARTLARRPGLILLDEPFTSLDASLRATTRRAVADALAAQGVTVLLVTHDQGEALSFADEVALMREGRIVQTGAPEEVYTAPIDQEAAAFLGEIVVLPGEVDADRTTIHTDLGAVTATHSLLTSDQRACDVGIRPEQVVVGPFVSGAPSGVVIGNDYFGHDAIVRIRIDGPDIEVVSRLPGSAMPTVGTRVGIAVQGGVLVLHS